MLQNWINHTASASYLDKLLTERDSCFRPHDKLTTGPNRKAIAIVGYGKELSQIRESFYNLDFSSYNIQITDLGDVRNNDPGLMTAAYKELISQNIFTIVIDPSINTSLAIGNALKSLEIPNNQGLVTPDTSYKSNSFSLISQLVEDEKVNLLSILGYQKHFANPRMQNIPNIDLAGLMSLGKIRDNFNEIEPLLRELTTLTFDTSVIRASDSHGIKNQHSFGLTGEEACKLIHYASSSEKLKAIHFSGYELEDNATMASELIACLVWYVISGKQVSEESPTSTDNMNRFIVELSDINEKVQFWKKQNSERWWVEIPSEKEKFTLVACSENEYKLACENKISDRLFHLFTNR